MRSRKRNADFRPRRPEPARYAHRFARILGSRPTNARAERYCTSGSRIRGRRRATQRTGPVWGLQPPLLRYDGMGRLSRRSRLPCDAPMPLALGIASRTPITLPANSPCTILIRAGNVVRDDLKVDIPPLRRTPTARGRTGWMVDRPRPGFKGGGRVWLLATRPIVSDPRDGDVSPAGDRKLGRAPSKWSLPSVCSSARFAAVSLAHLPPRRGHRSSSLCEPSHRPNAPRMTGSRA